VFGGSDFVLYLLKRNPHPKPDSGGDRFRKKTHFPPARHPDGGPVGATLLAGFTRPG